MIYLFWAHVIFWVALFIYIYGLIRKSESLKRELEAMKGQSKEGRVNWKKQEVK
ncbi:MAG TPA: hypothetical protein VNK81_04255 [Thermodesulfobacteriota bacterium]|jgi:CcmD family protein|nr:hypothetical protein [Thermodesulfobacteriota bacterium]